MEKNGYQKNLQGKLKIILIGAFLGLYAVLVWLLYFYPNNPRLVLKRNLAIAENHIPKLIKEIEGDHRFKDVRIAAYTKEPGYIGLFGEVRDQFSYDKLKRIVEDSRPPVLIYWEVQVLMP